MSRREDIDNAIWSDPEFHGLSPAAKLVYLWSFTNQRCGMAGLYKVVPGAIALETGLSGTDVSAALEELRQERFAHYENGVMWVRSRIKHLRTKTTQMARSIGGDLEKVSGPLHDALIEEYRDTAWAHLREVLLNLTRTSGDIPEKSDTYREISEPHPNVTRTSGEVPGQGQGRGSSEERPVAHAREAPPTDDLPDDLPERLHDAARQVQQRLERLHARKPRSIRPPLAAIGRVLASMPDRDHVAVADDVERYWTFGAGQNKAMRDLVATYRNRLSTAPVVAVSTNGAAAGGIDAIVNRAERRERLLDQQRREREAARASQ